MDLGQVKVTSHLTNQAMWRTPGLQEGYHFLEIIHLTAMPLRKPSSWQVMLILKWLWGLFSDNVPMSKDWIKESEKSHEGRNVHYHMWAYILYERVGEGYTGFVLSTPIFYFRFWDNMCSRLWATLRLCIHTQCLCKGTLLGTVV